MGLFVGAPNAGPLSKPWSRHTASPASKSDWSSANVFNLPGLKRWGELTRSGLLRCSVPGTQILLIHGVSSSIRQEGLIWYRQSKKLEQAFVHLKLVDEIELRPTGKPALTAISRVSRRDWIVIFEGRHDDKSLGPFITRIIFKQSRGEAVAVFTAVFHRAHSKRCQFPFFSSFFSLFISSRTRTLPEKSAPSTAYYSSEPNFRVNCIRLRRFSLNWAVTTVRSHPGRNSIE